jgi:hypothetical protein
VVLFLLLFLQLWSPVLPERNITRRRVAPGCVFVTLRDAERELAFYALSIDLHMPGISVRPVMPEEYPSGRETVPGMCRRVDRPGRRVVGGVNADFFTAAGPVGLCITSGHLLKSGRGWSSLAFTSRCRPLIVRLRPQMTLSAEGRLLLTISGLNVPMAGLPAVLYTPDFYPRLSARRGRRLLILSPTQEAVPSSGTLEARVEAGLPLDQPVSIPGGRWALALDAEAAADAGAAPLGAVFEFAAWFDAEGFRIHQAVSGGPRILRGGRISVEREQEGQRKGFDTERHPRTAAGFTQDGRYLILAVADGRQPGYARGVDLFELASLLREFGCVEALNLDGGGSSTMVVERSVVNRPSDLTGPRPVANALVVFYSGSQ